MEDRVQYALSYRATSLDTASRVDPGLAQSSDRPAIQTVMRQGSVRNHKAKEQGKSLWSDLACDYRTREEVKVGQVEENGLHSVNSANVLD